MKRAMMRAARESFLVVDSSKWAVNALAQIAPLDAFRAIVTDNGIPAAVIEVLARAGIRLITPARISQGRLDMLGVP